MKALCIPDLPSDAPACTFESAPSRGPIHARNVKLAAPSVRALAGSPEARVTGPAAKADRNGAFVTIAMGAARNHMPAWKRAIDLAGCVLALPLLGLCTLAMTILTRCVSPGPIFFQQERVGHLGKRFRIYKFRTMTMGADTSAHQSHVKDLIKKDAPMVKLDSHRDVRLIPLAWLLRASGLDELPQIINVLRGEMSLVGPRPCLPAEFEHFMPWQRQRCVAVPGLTGLWQVSGKNRTTFSQMILFDLQYVHEFSLWMDLTIMFLTAPCLVAQVYETRRARKAVTARAQ